jgi:hypothetical protein
MPKDDRHSSSSAATAASHPSKCTTTATTKSKSKSYKSPDAMAHWSNETPKQGHWNHVAALYAMGKRITQEKSRS